MILTDISQKIVDATMEIIDNRNINIMDRKGYIIASGEKNRIDTYHKGAADVIESGKYIEIYPEDVSNYPGSKEGVNMPIHIQDKVIGVVGVYGHPDTVRVVAKLVKMSVELAYEQHLLSEQVKLVRDLKQELIRKLIYGEPQKDEEELLCLSKVVGVNLNIKRRCIIIENEEESLEDSLITLKKMNDIENYLINNSFINRDDFSGSVNQLYIIFKIGFDNNSKTEVKYLEKIKEGIYDNLGFNVKVSIGSLHEKMAGYKNSFLEARTLQKMNGEKIKDINDLNVKVNYILYSLDNNLLKHFIEPLYKKILDEKGKILLWVVETLKSYFSNNLNVSDAAKELFLHRNTLLYRIKKIEEITGLSINSKFNDAVLVKLLLIYIEKYKKEEL